MGCDINIIVEIKKDNVWTHVEDVPKSFKDRSYGVFSVLNKNIRNYNRIDGFEPKGLPKDLSIKKCRFVSEKQQLLSAYLSGEEEVCVKSDGTFIGIFDEALTTEVSYEIYNAISEENVYKSKYHFSIIGNKDGKYYIQDASKVNGKFEKRKYTEIYKTLSEFNNAYYHYQEVDDDFGYYDVDFDANYLYGHSYLTLSELRKKDKIEIQGKSYTINKEFYQHLIDELEELPDAFIVSGEAKNTVEIIWSPDPEKAMIFTVYSDGIREMENIKQKYKIKSDEDIRIVFAFDS